MKLTSLLIFLTASQFVLILFLIHNGSPRIGGESFNYEGLSLPSDVEAILPNLKQLMSGELVIYHGRYADGEAVVVASSDVLYPLLVVVKEAGRSTVDYGFFDLGGEVFSISGDVGGKFKNLTFMIDERRGYVDIDVDGFLDIEFDFKENEFIRANIDGRWMEVVPVDDGHYVADGDVMVKVIFDGLKFDYY